MSGQEQQNPQEIDNPEHDGVDEVVPQDDAFYPPEVYDGFDFDMGDDEYDEMYMAGYADEYYDDNLDWDEDLWLYDDADSEMWDDFGDEVDYESDVTFHINDEEIANQPQLLNQTSYQQFANINCGPQTVMAIDNLSIFHSLENNFIDVAVCSLDRAKVWRIPQNTSLENPVVNQGNIQENNEENGGEQIFVRNFNEVQPVKSVAFSTNGLTLVVAASTNSIIMIFQRESLNSRFEPVYNIICTEDIYRQIKQLVFGKWGNQDVLAAVYQHAGNAIGFLNISDTKIQNPEQICFQFEQEDSVLCQEEVEVSVVPSDVFQNIPDRYVYSLLLPATLFSDRINTCCFSKQGDLFVAGVDGQNLSLYFLNSDIEHKLALPTNEIVFAPLFQNLSLNNSGMMLACSNNSMQSVYVWRRPSRQSFEFQLQVKFQGYNRPCISLEFSKFDDNLLVHSERHRRLYVTQFLIGDDSKKIERFVHQNISLFDEEQQTYEGARKLHQICGISSTTEGDVLVACEKKLFKLNAKITESRIPEIYKQAMEVFELEVVKKYDLPPLVIKKIKEMALYPIGVWMPGAITENENGQNHMSFVVDDTVY